MLAGSRKQEIKDNLRRMTVVSKAFPRYQFVVAGAPGIDVAYYRRFLTPDVRIVFNQTYQLLKYSEAALVTSGTATLETALFRVPQVVCYYISCGRIVSFLRRLILKVKYISLVNLVAGKTVVSELVADGMTVNNMEKELEQILAGKPGRKKMLAEYDRLAEILGKEGASVRTARLIYSKILSRKCD